VRVTIRLKHSFDQVLVDGVNVEHKINAFYFWSAPLHLGGALPLQVHTLTCLVNGAATGMQLEQVSAQQRPVAA
jgi:hypothetical protein